MTGHCHIISFHGCYNFLSDVVSGVHKGEFPSPLSLLSEWDGLAGTQILRLISFVTKNCRSYLFKKFIPFKVVSFRLNTLLQQSCQLLKHFGYSSFRMLCHPHVILCMIFGTSEISFQFGELKKK